jgi:hypothetical protein
MSARSISCPRDLPLRGRAVRLLVPCVTILLAACVRSGPDTLTRAVDGIVAHPDSLVFPALEIDPPRAEDHRLELDKGVVCYLASHSFVPLVRIEAMVPTDGTGSPPGSPG